MKLNEMKIGQMITAKTGTTLKEFEHKEADSIRQAFKNDPKKLSKAEKLIEEHAIHHQDKAMNAEHGEKPTTKRAEHTKELHQKLNELGKEAKTNLNKKKQEDTKTDKSWFKNLSKEAQDHYKKMHPNSHLAK